MTTLRFAKEPLPDWPREAVNSLLTHMMRSGDEHRSFLQRTSAELHQFLPDDKKADTEQDDARLFDSVAGCLQAMSFAGSETGGDPSIGRLSFKLDDTIGKFIVHFWNLQDDPEFKVSLTDQFAVEGE